MIPLNTLADLPCVRGKNQREWIHLAEQYGKK